MGFGWSIVSGVGGFKKAKKVIEKEIAKLTGVEEARRANDLAEQQIAQEREALAALQREPEPALPTADDESVRRARRRSRAAQLARRGRQSTILTDSGDGGSLGV